MDRTSQISAILDPRSKLSAFKNDEEKEQAKTVILELTSYCNALSHYTEDNASDEIVDVRNYFRQLREKNAFINSNSTRPTTIPSNLASLPAQPTTPHTNTNNQLPILAELTRYLSTPLEDKIDPLLWWHAQKNEYPILSLIARDFLSVQATSVASEQAFSIAGQTITARRNRLDPDVARASLCLRSWIRNNLYSD